MEDNVTELTNVSFSTSGLDKCYFFEANNDNNVDGGWISGYHS